MERLMCPECNEIEEGQVPGDAKHHVGYTCSYLLCGILLQADFEIRVENTNPAAVSFGPPKPCACDQREESARTPLLAPSPEQVNIALIQSRKRKNLKRH
jgi:hypothetical protein